jgi:hypothetical protein
MTGFYNFEQIESIYKKEGPKYVSLENDKGQKIVLLNNSKVPVATRFEEIKKALKRSTLEPGIYYYIQRNTLRKTGEIQRFPINIGNVDKQPEQTPPIMPISENIPSIWTPEKALNILNENTRLTLELKAANEKIAELEETIDELEDEIKANPGISEGQPGQLSAIERIMTTVTPLIDKLLSQRDQQLNLAQQKINQFREAPKPETDEQIINKINGLIVRGDEQNLELALNDLQNRKPELYQHILQQINNP